MLGIIILAKTYILLYIFYITYHYLYNFKFYYSFSSVAGEFNFDKI